MPSPPLLITPLSRADLESRRAQLAQSGITLSGDRGTITAQGCTLLFNYAEPVLTITILDKPWLVPEPVIYGQIRKWFGV